MIVDYIQDTIEPRFCRRFCSAISAHLTVRWAGSALDGASPDPDVASVAAAHPFLDSIDATIRT